MKYESTKAKVNKLIEDFILPEIRTKELDYYKVISFIKLKTGASDVLIKETIEAFISQGKIMEYRALMLPNDKFINELEEHYKQLESDIKEAGLNGSNDSIAE